MAQSKDFTMYRGDSRKITVSFSDNIIGVITDGIVRMTVKLKKGDPDDKAVIQKTENVTLVDGKYQAIINLLPDDTDTLNIKSYYQDIQFSSAEKVVVKTIVAGKLKLLEDITRTV